MHIFASIKLFTIRKIKLNSNRLQIVVYFNFNLFYCLKITEYTKKSLEKRNIDQPVR